MKATCLTLAILVLAGAYASSAPGAAAPAKRFTAYAWSGKVGVFDNIVPFFWIRKNDFDPAKAKEATDAMPEGRRALFSWDAHRDLSENKEDNCRDASGNLTGLPGIWWDRGAAEVAKRFDEYFRKYKELGGRVDVFVLDSEANMSNWSFRKDDGRWAAVQADSRFPPIAKQLGFSDLRSVAEWWTQQGDLRENYNRWNALMEKRVAAYTGQAVYEPLRKHFPKAKMSNYGACYNAPEFACPDSNGHNHSKYGAGAHVGTHQSASLYASLGQLKARKLDGQRPYGDGPFNALRLSVNRMRSMTLSSRTAVQPWLSHKNFAGGGIRDTDLYQELIFHTGLCGPDDILFWNPQMYAKNQKAEEYTDARQDRLLSDCLVQLDELVGAADRKTLIDGLAGWYDDYLLTGMSAGGRTVWRFTPRLEAGAALESVLAGAAPSVKFKVGAVTITIPGGKIYKPRTELSKAGFWIVAPLGAKPVIGG